jgi:small subunit ribosomal protein S13
MSLESFFGVGGNVSSRLMARFNIHPTCRVGELANKQVLDLTAVLSEMKIENDLRREVLNDIKRLKETGTYRGRRHALGLPVRGQRTRTQVSLPFSSVLFLHELEPIYCLYTGRVMANRATDQNSCQVEPYGAQAVNFGCVRLFYGTVSHFCVRGMELAFCFLALDLCQVVCEWNPSVDVL